MSANSFSHDVTIRCTTDRRYRYRKRCLWDIGAVHANFVWVNLAAGRLRTERIKGSGVKSRG